MKVLITKSCERGSREYGVGRDYVVADAVGADMVAQGFAIDVDKLEDKSASESEEE